jgi:hypothetical protein
MAAGEKLVVCGLVLGMLGAAGPARAATLRVSAPSGGADDPGCAALTKGLQLLDAVVVWAAGGRSQ